MGQVRDFGDGVAHDRVHRIGKETAEKGEAEDDQKHKQSQAGRLVLLLLRRAPRFFVFDVAPGAWHDRWLSETYHLASQGPSYRKD